MKKQVEKPVSRRIFITGTDTEVGKTWLTEQATCSLLASGLHACALKPVACGLDPDGRNEDISSLLDAQGLTDPDAINCYRFAKPAAPAQAAAAEKRSIDPVVLLNWCDRTAASFEISLIEGVGGLMVPLTDTYLVSHWLADMPDCEVWLVAGCRLGAINHTLLTLAALRELQRIPAYIFVNAAHADDQTRLQATAEALRPFVDKSCKIHTLSHQMQLDVATLLCKAATNRELLIR